MALEARPLEARRGGAEEAVADTGGQVLDLAAEHLNRAVEWLRRAGQENDLPRGRVLYPFHKFRLARHE